MFVSLKRLLLVLLAFSPVLAEDRYVFLDTDKIHCSVTTATLCSSTSQCPNGEVCVGDGFLNQCSNPAHNTNSPISIGSLSYCSGGDNDGRMIGSRTTGTNYVADCPAGTATKLTNGAHVDILGDGTLHYVYGSPQACVYAMAKSDTCYVHAGDYNNAGVRSTASGVLPTGQCDRSDCWYGTVGAFGYFADGHTDGYGTAASPGYLRGAVANGSTDTWDPNGDKDPSDGLYVPIFNGNIDGDAVLNENTTCTDSYCLQDAFYSVMVGCGNTNTGEGFCTTSPTGGQVRPKIDSDANGTFDTSASTGGSRSIAYLTIKDIEFKNYNGGAATCSSSGIREGLGHFMLGGGGTTSGNGDGIVIDHVYWHDDSYSGLCQNEHYVAVFGDDENWACSSATSTIPGTTISVAGTIISNSYVVTKNRSVLNDDCDATQPGASECGCSKYFYNDRLVLANQTGGQYQNFARWKSVNTVGGGTRPKRLVWTNTEFIVQRGDAGGSTYMFAPECTGLCDPHHVAAGAQGVIQVNGSLIRYQGTAPAIHRFSESFCGDTFRFCENGTTPCSGTGIQSACSGIGGGTCSVTSAAGINWIQKRFNNTFDLEKIGGGNTTLDYLCNTNGSLSIDRNNAYFGVSTINSESSTVKRFANDACSAQSTLGCTLPSPNLRTDWWTFGTQNVAVNAGLANYIPKSGGPLYEKTGVTACDPDGDTNTGVDWYGTGSDVTSWKDISGNTVDCSIITNPLSYGAIQPNNDGAVSVGPSQRRGVIKRGVIVR